MPHAPDVDEITLSTGETIGLPVSLQATMTAVAVPADRDRVADLLPSGLSPIRAGRGVAPVWLLSAEYHAIDDGALEPYNEFAVSLGATYGDPAGVPYISPLFRNEGFVWYMPVTHESARAFGDEIWGYPKVVGEIDITETDGRRETTVTVDGEHFITMAIKRPWTISRGDGFTAYTVNDDTLLRIRGDLAGEMGMWPFSSRFSYTLGEHPKARELSDLDLENRAFSRFYAEAECTIHPGQPLQRQP